MKKFMKLTIVALLVLALAGCNATNQKDAATEGITETADNSMGGSTEVTNPFVEYETLDEAGEHVDFEVKSPNDVPEGYELAYISVIENELVQLVYEKGESKLTYRQGNGTKDVSGDYSVYNEVNVETIVDNEVTLSGQDSKVNLAVWTDGICSYSVSLDIGGEGVDHSVITNIIEGI